jgi:hypothetical protein
MSTYKRLDAPPADLRELDRGPLTKAAGPLVEPRITPRAEPIVLNENKVAKAAPAPKADLSKVLREMEKFATLAVKAAERSEAAAKRIEAALVEKSAPTLKSALAKIEAAAQKKGR